jgi:hypothetical protein
VFNPNSKDNHGLSGVGDGSPFKSVSASTAAVAGARYAASSMTLTPASYIAAYSKLLPANGKEILLSSELPAAKDPELVAALKQTLGDPVVDTAIVLGALGLYLENLKPEIEAVSGKDEEAIRDFTTKLKAWPLLARVYFLACNDVDPPGQRDQVKKLVDQAVAYLSGSSAKKAAATLLDQYDKIKAAQVTYWKAQIGLSVAFDLYEFRTLGTNTTKATWRGPVPMRPETANSAGVYPLPDCFLPKQGSTDGLRNPIVWCQMPGLADYLPSGSYPAGGINLASDAYYANLFEKGLKSPDTFASDYAYMVMEDQWRRLYGGTVFTKYKDKFVTRTVADFVNLGIQQDPEWNCNAVNWRSFGWAASLALGGGALGASVGGLGLMFPLQAAIAALNIPMVNNRASEVLPQVCKVIMAAHASARKDASSPVFAAYKAYRGEMEKMRNTIVNTCAGIPPVPVSWRVFGKLLQPTYDFEAWLKAVSGPASFDVAASGKRFFPEYGGGFVGYVADCLQATFKGLRAGQNDAIAIWDPSKTFSPFPTKLLNKKQVLDQIGKALAMVQKQRDAVSSKLSPVQVAWANARAEVKGYLLLASRLLELGLKSENTTESVVDTLAEFAFQLYGVTLPNPPESMPATEYKDWYDKVLVEAAKNPSPQSLMGQILQLQAAYEKNPTPATLKKLREVQIKMGSLIARRARRRGLVLDNTLSKGGTKPLAELSKSAVQKADAASLKKVDLSAISKLGTVSAGASGAEKQVGATVSTGATTLENKTNKDLGYAYGSGSALTELIGQAGLSVGDAVTDQINATKQTASDNLPKAKKKSNPLLLILLAGAAYAATKD